MNLRDSKVIRNFVLKAHIDEVEFYEEIYDHVASSYEHRIDSKQTIEEHIEQEIAPSFGGIEGLESMIDAQKRMKRSRIFNDALKRYFSFFTTISGLAKSMLLATVIYLLSIYTTETLFSNIIGIVFILPALAAYIMQARFKHLCRKRRLPFKTSFTNRIVFFVSTMFIACFQGVPDIVSRIVIGKRFNVLNYLEQFEFIVLPFVFHFSIYAIVCLTLISKRLQLKTSLNT
ncbi:hypothetical protein [Roseivirga sp.]|uniref:hypothetical protein n=1 Tax=Roseivirga sp. TaxID=1964215 RepID=UPI003B8B7313